MTATHDFVRLMIDSGVLRFGSFELKSGRISPYFFNLGSVNTGKVITLLGAAYAEGIVARGMLPDVVFGPAYKGIPIAVATAIALHRDYDLNVGFAFNRKERKSHGEGGSLVGHPLEGDVLVVDDVMTAGTAVAEAAALVRGSGARLAGVLVALDRQELTDEGGTAVAAMRATLGVSIEALATLEDVIAYLDLNRRYADPVAQIRAYQDVHCAVTQ